MKRAFRRGAAALAAITVASTLAACAPAVDDTTATASAASDGVVTIYLTRHGETMLNELDRVQGWSDSPLTESGREDAENLGEGLRAAGVDIDAAYSADMVRHFETASLALEGAGSDLEPTRDERLREMSFGLYEGAENAVMWDAVAEELGYEGQEELFADFANVGYMNALDAIAASAADAEGDLVPETSSDVEDRALEALTDIARDQENAGGGGVLVVSSGITIMCVLTALDADLSGVTSGIDNAAVSQLTYADGEWAVDTVNDLSYVEAGAES